MILSGVAAIANAQSIVGSWKKTDEVLTKENGRTSNSFNMLVKNMPCFANIVYIFSAGGKMDEQAKDCAPFLQKQVASQIKNSRWAMSGKKLIMDVADKSSPVQHAEYEVEFIGQNEMIWTFVYADNPGVPNITKAKQMKTTYIRQ